MEESAVLQTVLFSIHKPPDVCNWQVLFCRKYHTSCNTQQLAEEWRGEKKNSFRVDLLSRVFWIGHRFEFWQDERAYGSKTTHAYLISLKILLSCSGMSHVWNWETTKSRIKNLFLCDCWILFILTFFPPSQPQLWTKANPLKDLKWDTPGTGICSKRLVQMDEDEAQLYACRQE